MNSPSAVASAATILVAEDNPVNQEVILEQLTLLGYTAEVADDGEQAFQRWLKGRHALLLTDLQMPRMDGFQLARVVREHEARHGLDRTRIVALSARHLASDDDRCRRAGIDDQWVKPVDLDQLQARLQRWLPLPLPRAATAPAAAPHDPTAGAVLDPSTLRQYVGDDPETLRWFREEFRRRLAGIRQALDAAWQQGDLADLGGLAHQLKSAARTVGAQHLDRCCEALEQAARAGRADATAQHWPALCRAIDEAGRALDALLPAD